MSDHRDTTRYCACWLVVLIAVWALSGCGKGDDADRQSGEATRHDLAALETGTYTVEVLTWPMRSFEDVAIAAESEAM